MAVVTTNHKPGGIKQHKFINPQSVGWKSDVGFTGLKSKHWQGRRQGRQLPRLFQLLEAAHVPWFTAPQGSNAVSLMILQSHLFL